MTLKKRSFANLSKAEAERVAEFMEEKVVDAVKKFNLIGGSSAGSFHLYNAIHDAVMQQWKIVQSKKETAENWEKVLLGEELKARLLRGEKLKTPLRATISIDNNTPEDAAKEEPDDSEE